MSEDLRRPYLKSNIQLMDAEDGIYFYGPNGSIFIKAPGAQRAIHRFCRSFDGSMSRADLQAKLGTNARRLLDGLIDQLTAHRLLLMHLPFEPAMTPSAAEASRFGQVISYLRDQVVDFHVQFRRLRGATAVIVGAGVSLTSAAKALVQSGVGRLAIHPVEADRDAGWRRELEACLQRARAADDGFSGSIGEGALHAGELAPGMALYVCDDLDVETAALRDFRGRAFPLAFVCGVLQQAGVVLHPAAKIDDARERLRRTPVASNMLGTASPVFLSVCGSVAGLALLNAFAGVSAGNVVHQFLRLSPSLELSWHTLLPTGEAASAGVEPVAQQVAPRSNVPGPFEVLLDRFAPAFDAQAGPLLLRDAGDLPQIPLSLDAIELRWPRHVHAADERQVGWGLSVDDAGIGTLRKALKAYLSRTVPASLHDGDFYFHADVDSDAWRARAKAGAMLRSPAIRERHIALEVEIARVEDNAVQMLSRMAQAYFIDAPRVVLRCVPGLDFFHSSCVLLGGYRAEGFSLTPVDAVRESVGGALAAAFSGCLEETAGLPPLAVSGRTDLSGAALAALLAGGGKKTSCIFETRMWAGDSFWNALELVAGSMRVSQVDGDG